MANPERVSPGHWGENKGLSRSRSPVTFGSIAPGGGRRVPKRAARWMVRCGMARRLLGKERAGGGRLVSECSHPSGAGLTLTGT